MRTWPDRKKRNLQVAVSIQLGRPLGDCPYDEGSTIFGSLILGNPRLDCFSIALTLGSLA